MYGRSRVNVKVEPRSTFTFMRDLSNIVSVLFTRVGREKLRDSGNQPLRIRYFIHGMSERCCYYQHSQENESVAAETRREQNANYLYSAVRSYVKHSSLYK